MDIEKLGAFYLGKTDLEFLEDKDQARQVMETDQRIMRSGKAEQIEERVDMPDGSATIWLSAKAPLLDAAGEVIGLIGSSIDVTARKSAETALRDLNRTLEARIAQAVAERFRVGDLYGDFAKATKAVDAIVLSVGRRVCSGDGGDSWHAARPVLSPEQPGQHRH